MSSIEAVVRVLAALAATGLLGWSVARFFVGDRTRLEIAAWSFATGLLAQSTVLLVIFAIGARPAAPTILLADALVIGASLAVRRPTRPRPETRAEAPPRERAVLVALAAVAGAAWSLFLLQALAEPMWATDYLAIWGLKGKTITLTGGLPARLFQDPALYWAHKEYPLLVPLSLSALAFLSGGWNDQALALLYPACELATLFALAGFLARRVSRVSGAAGAALATSCFPLYHAVNAGTAEIPFAFAVVLVCGAFLDALEKSSSASRWRLLAASLFCVSIKPEGTLLVLLLAGLLALRARMQRSRTRWAGVGALLVPPVLHWTLLHLLRGPQTPRDFDLTLFEPRRFWELSALFAVVVERMLGTEARQAAVPLLAIALYIALTRRGIGDALLPVFSLQILCYAIAFSVSSFDPIYAIEAAFRRIALTLFPAFTLVLAARLPTKGDPATGSVAPP